VIASQAKVRRAVRWLFVGAPLRAYQRGYEEGTGHSTEQMLLVFVPPIVVTALGAVLGRTTVFFYWGLAIGLALYVYVALVAAVVKLSGRPRAGWLGDDWEHRSRPWWDRDFRQRRGEGRGRHQR
jgi:hypothetical protein